MILVTLGTQDKPFIRLLKEIQECINKGIINEKVIVQAGCTRFESTDMEIFDLIPMEEFDKLIEQCNILITHGGVGSIITGLKKDKKVIAVPRKSEYGEHVNNHQIQIIENFDKAGYIIGALEPKDIEKALQRINHFTPNQYTSNSKNMIKLVESLIDSNKKKCGIFTISNAKNYGSVLQAYALKKSCLKYIDEVYVINYINKKIKKEYSLIKFQGNNIKEKLLSFIKCLIILPYSIKKSNKFRNFSKNYLNLTKKYYEKNLNTKYPIFDKYIVGSDQVWNSKVTSGLREAYLLNFIKDSEKKITYAASISNPDISLEDIKKLKESLSSFKNISVREKSTKEMLAQNGINSVVSIDSTMLLEKDDWDNLLKNKKEKYDKYIFVYAFENDKLLKSIVEDLSQKCNLKVISFDIKKKYKNSYGNFYASGPEDFIYLIKNAEFIVTNSFHATVFSIIYEKEFFSIPFKNRTDRVTELLNKLNIKDRIIVSYDDYKKINKTINYNSVKETLNLLKKESLKYLEDSLSETIYGNKINCCGCTACLNVCPTEAITMKKDNKGFNYPVIDKEKCIKCGMCRNVCPLKNKLDFNNNLNIYAAKNKNIDIRKKSSSGGIFYLLAENIIADGGVVYGAQYDEQLKVEHTRINKKVEIQKLMGSKYTQSDMKRTFKNVSEDLVSGKIVLFSGTPCQISGLYKYLELKRIKTDKLITIDIICHSVPSNKVYKDYIKYMEKKYKSKIKKINFRNKSNHKINNLSIEFENGKNYIGSVDKDIYYRLFFLELINRDSCYNCRFKSFERISDITIGDYWEISRLDKSFDDENGVSLVLINTNKGQELFNKIKNKIEYKESSRDICIQPSLKNNVRLNHKTDKFWNDYEKKNLIKIYNKYDNSLLIKIKKLIKKTLRK